MINMVKFNKITNTNHKDFKDAIIIYEESFPSNERQTKETIEQRIKENIYQMFIGYLKNSVVFMALLLNLKDSDFVLLDYMVTKEEFRNRGIGTKFLKKIMEQTKPKYMILEVENPEYGNNKRQRKQRVKFYKNLGAKEMKNTRYVLPPLSGNIQTEMILMVLPNYCNGKMDGNLVKKIIIQIYKEVYNRNFQDDLLNSFINNVKNPVELI